MTEACTQLLGLYVGPGIYTLDKIVGIVQHKSSVYATCLYVAGIFITIRQHAADLNVLLKLVGGLA